MRDGPRRRRESIYSFFPLPKVPLKAVLVVPQLRALLMHEVGTAILTKKLELALVHGLCRKWDLLSDFGREGVALYR